MTSSVTGPEVRSAVLPGFYFWLTTVMAAFVFGGFAFTYLRPMAAGTLAPLPPIVHLHGFVFFSWMILLVVQSGLINAKKVQLHRGVGMVGIALAALVFFMGLQITIMFDSVDSPATNPDYYDLAYLGFAAPSIFAVLFFFAMRHVRRPENHKRLVLLAVIPLLPPGINRLYMSVFALSGAPILATYLTMDALVAAIAIHDWKRRGAVSKATLAGAALILLQQLLHWPLVGSVAFAGFVEWSNGLVYYR